MAKPNQAPNNPFACASNAVKMHTVGPCCGSLLAVYSYEVQDAGKSVIFTPLTGFDSTDLKYYRWSVVDQYGNDAGGAIDLGSPSAAVTVNTSGLDVNGGFKVKFAACKKNGQEDASLSYDIMINNVTSNPTGDSVPVNYENVQMLLKLTSTDDANFSLFPVDGLEINSKDLINLTDFLAVAGQLVNTGSYVFSVEAKKCWYSPEAVAPFYTGTDVIASANVNGGALSSDYISIMDALTINTTATGVFAVEVTTGLKYEDVQPNFYFTLKTDVA